MAAAAQHVLDHFADELAAIRSSGGNEFLPVVNNPATGIDEQLPPTSIGHNELLLFVGGRDLGDTTLAFGGGGTYVANGTPEYQDEVATRGQPADANVDYAPWGGHIAFDIDADWHFGVGSDNLPANSYDFYTVAVHEMLHLMGFADSVTAFNRHVSENRFGGPNATAAHDINGPPKLAPNHAHWADTVRDDGRIPIMGPTVANGQRGTITELDLAAMQDIGWELVSTNDGVITAEHTYIDDGVYFGTINLSSSSESATAPFRIIVENIPPRLTGISNQEASVGEPVLFETTIVDPGLIDTHEVTVDWGDGTQESLAIQPDGRSVTATHAFGSVGTYIIEFTVRDSDGASRTHASAISVSPLLTSAWQNRANPLDVNNDNIISPIDALLVINELNRRTVSDSSGRLPSASANKVDDHVIDAFFDVNGDDFVSANDALLVINELNQRTIASRAKTVYNASSRLLAAAIDFIHATDESARLFPPRV